MARTVGGQEAMERARQVIAKAKTVEQLRQAQAVLLPLEHGLSLSDTAKALGLSLGWVCRLRNAFIRGKEVGDGSIPPRGGRRRQNFTSAREQEVLQPFLERAATGGVLVVPELKPHLEAALGRPMALSSVYNLLHRQGWRKLAPDKRHPKSDPLAQEAFKKTFPSGWHKLSTPFPPDVP